MNLYYIKVKTFIEVDTTIFSKQLKFEHKNSNNLRCIFTKTVDIGDIQLSVKKMTLYKQISTFYKTFCKTFSLQIWTFLNKEMNHRQNMDVDLLFVCFLARCSCIVIKV